MDNKEFIKRLVSFDDDDTSTGHVSVSGGNSLSEYQDLLRMAGDYIRDKDLAGFRVCASEFITKVCEEYGETDGNKIFGGQTDYYYFITDNGSDWDLPIQDLGKVTERYQQGNRFYLEIIGVGSSDDMGALVAVTNDEEYKGSVLSIRKFKDLWWNERPEIFIDMDSHFANNVSDKPFVWRNARALHKYLSRLLNHLRFVQ